MRFKFRDSIDRIFCILEDLIHFMPLFGALFFIYDRFITYIILFAAQKMKLFALSPDV